MSKPFNMDMWINANLYNLGERPDFDGMKKMAEALSLPEGRVVFNEHSLFSSGLDISYNIRSDRHRYLCRTLNQVAMLPQRVYQERMDSYFKAYFVKPLAVLSFIAALLTVFTALDRYSIHRLNTWIAYLEQQDCISPVSGDIIRDTARCGKLDLKYAQRLQWPMKVGIAIGIIIGSVVLFLGKLCTTSRIHKIWSFFRAICAKQRHSLLRLVCSQPFGWLQTHLPYEGKYFSALSRLVNADRTYRRLVFFASPR